MLVLSHSGFASPLSSFTLSDQYDQRHVINFPSNQLRLLIVADQGSAGDAREWGTYLMKSPLKSVAVVPIAAMGDVPELFRGFAKTYITVKRPTLLDWNNRISKRLGFTKNECLVLLLDPNGLSLAAVKGRPTADKVGILVQASGLNVSEPIRPTSDPTNSEILPSANVL